MFSYYLELALRSLKRSPGLTLLMVLAIGFGVAASMTTYSVFRAVSGDPIPWKSSQLFVPQIDVWGPTGRGADGEPPNALDYIDAVALMRDHRAKLQSASYRVAPTVQLPGSGLHPISVQGHAVYSEFFPMLDVPFAYGSGWAVDADTNQAAIVVISGKLNQKMFGGGNSVGKTLEISGKDYQIVGVLGKWDPQPRFYDVVDTGGFDTNSDDVFLPFTRAIAVDMNNAGSTSCTNNPVEPGFVGMQRSTCVWIEFMAELDDAAAVKKYRNYLEGYALAQKSAGRFNWAPNNRLRDVPAFLDNQHVVPSDTKVSMMVAFGLLIVCLVNTVGLLLAKFLRRSSEIGVRRALGAPQAAIYAQFLTEAGIVGLAGGVVGLLFTGVGVFSVGMVLPEDIAALAHVNFSLLLLTLVVSVISAVLAGLYPTFRASRVQPAWQLKSN
jgi:putative ABC transport system permease protein